tara:strand:- start:318 stop:479 length:162 start_codon:yes stop_codon:yes gene_type:complete
LVQTFIVSNIGTVERSIGAFVDFNFKIIPVKKQILILPVLEIQIEKYFKPSQI